MHKNGLIDKNPESNGRKIYKLSLTKKGREIKEKIFKTDITLRSEITKGITEQELVTTFETLEKMNKNIRDKVKLQI